MEVASSALPPALGTSIPHLVHAGVTTFGPALPEQGEFGPNRRSPGSRRLQLLPPASSARAPGRARGRRPEEKESCGGLVSRAPSVPCRQSHSPDRARTKLNWQEKPEAAAETQSNRDVRTWLRRATAEHMGEGMLGQREKRTHTERGRHRPGARLPALAPATPRLRWPPRSWRGACPCHPCAPPCRTSTRRRSAAR